MDFGKIYNESKRIFRTLADLLYNVTRRIASTNGFSQL